MSTLPAQGLADHRPRLLQSQPPAVGCALLDLDGDGDLDLARASAAGGVVLALQDASGRFVPIGKALQPIATNTSGIRAIAAGQLTLDKVPDVLVAYRNGAMAVLVSNGKGGVLRTFRLPALRGVIAPPLLNVLVGGLEPSAGDDIVVLLNNLPPQVYLSNGRGGYAAPYVVIGPSVLNPAATLVDIDQDKDLDMVFATGDRRKPALPLPHELQRASNSAIASD